MRKLNHKGISIVSILIATWFLLGEVVYGDNIRFKNLDNEDGLSQSTGEVILQDKKGYIWIGTADGLNRFNGYDFKIYRNDQWSENSIANNYIVCLKEDEVGNLWVGTANGLSKINLKTDKITNYYSEKENGNISHNNIGDILITKNGKILVGTSDGLNIYDPEKDKFERILDGKNDLTSQYIRTLEYDNKGNLWIGTKNGINKIDIKNKKITKLLYSESSEEKDVYVLRHDDSGYMWAGTFSDGLFRIDVDNNKTKEYTHNEEDTKSIPGNSIRDIYKDKNNTLWVGTDKGLAKLNKDGTFTVYNNKTNDKNLIAHDIIYSITEDSSGLIWVGTYSGISVFDPNNNIIHYKNSLTDENSLSENVVHGIYEDEEGLLWVGTKSKGLNVINRKNDTINHINRETTDYLMSDDYINCITGKGSKIYVGTKNGLNIIDKSKKDIKVYDKSKGLSDSDIKSLLIDSKGYLWVGTSKGISILNTKNYEIIDLKEVLKKNNLESLFAKVIYEDKEGIYWIGCFIDNGLIRMNPKDNSVKIYKHDKNNNKSISSNTIRTIEEDKYGNLWIGTSYGLNKLDKKTDTFTSYSTKDGLSNDVVYGILIDDNDDIWLSTNLGLSKLNTKNNTFQNFTVTDGLQGNEFNGNAAYKNKNGELIFGGINGLNIFKPSDISNSEYTPKIVFDYFEVNGEPYTDINNMKFKYNENFININLFLPDYRNIKNVQYYYKLEGENEEWVSVKSNNINYGSLDTGEHTLKVRARSHNGLMTDESSINFTIKPPFYKSRIAILIYIIIAIVIVYFVLNRVKYLDSLVKKKTRQLSEEVEKSKELFNKVIELERRKNSYFVNLSHELRTPLNVIHSTEQLINEINKSEKGIEREKLVQYMNLMGRNTKRLLTLINNLIDTTKIEHGNYEIKLKENNIVYVVEEAALSLKDYIENRGIELIIDPEIEEKIILCDDTEIERCIVNLVSNAAKFTPENGKIIVAIREEEDNVVITVEDNGIGIDKKYHETIFNRFSQVVDPNAEVKRGSGLGLTITKQIIELHNGKIYIESEVNKGSKFTIIL